MNCRDSNKLHMFVGVDGQCVHCGAAYEAPLAKSIDSRYSDLIRAQYRISQEFGRSLDELMNWGAERNLYSRQLQDANKRIHELEKELLKLREELKALTSGQTVSVPLSAWNKLCAEAAQARPLAEEKPETFPARALRFSA